MKRQAFTLIELLVVIAIIAILAAILFPVFAQAKDAAKKTQSLSNMKQIGTSVMIYIADYDDILPLSAYLKPPVAPNPRPIVFSVYEALDPYMKNLQILVSPSDNPGQAWRGRLELLNLTSEKVERASYVPNLGLFGEYLCGTPIKSAFTPVQSHSGLQEPVNTTMFFDGYIRRNIPTLDYFTFIGMARHADGLVINFADSHAKYFRYPAINGIAREYTTPAGSRAPRYYSWRQNVPENAACGSDDLCKSAGELEAVTVTPANPYNDLHGVPGSNITDSEDTQACP